LVNALFGSARVMVDDVPGTTRDSTDTAISHLGQTYTLIDTAGLRRHKAVYKTRDAIEYYSVLRTISALERCDVAVVLIEATEHLVKQDVDIINQVLEAGKGLVLAVNKWDLVPNKDTDTSGLFISELWRRYPFSAHLPVVFISAETGQRVTRVLDEVAESHGEWQKRVVTSDLNAWLTQLNRTNPPPGTKRGVPKINYVTQVSISPPTFLFFVNNPDFIGQSAERYLERTLREAFGFRGTPIRLKFRKK